MQDLVENIDGGLSSSGVISVQSEIRSEGGGETSDRDTESFGDGHIIVEALILNEVDPAVGGLTPDGQDITYVEGMYVLLNNNVDETENGVWVIGSGAWTRQYMDQMKSCCMVLVKQGLYKETLWLQMYEFEEYDEGVTELKWKNVSAYGTGDIEEENLDPELVKRLSHWWKRIGLPGSGLGGGSLTWLVPPSAISPPHPCFPEGVFFCYVRATFTQQTMGQDVNNGSSPTLSINGESVNTSPRYMPSVGSSARLVNVVLTGGRIIDMRGWIPSARIIDVTINLPNGTTKTAIGQMDVWKIEETLDEGEFDTYE